MHRTLNLASEPHDALEALRDASRRGPVLVFKKSPICPVSTAAERAFELWLQERRDGRPLTVAWIDVLAERPLARGLTAELGVRHESPQALYFEDGELRWHGSHGELTVECFEALLEPEAR